MGKEQVRIGSLADLEIKDKSILIKPKNDAQDSRCAHGLTRTLVANAVDGVTTGFKKDLEISGVGYRAELRGKILKLSLGFSHIVDFTPHFSRFYPALK